MTKRHFTNRQNPRRNSQRIYYIFAAHYLPYLGGLELYIQHMAQGLLAGGHQVLVITPNPGGLPSYEKIDGVSILRLPSFPLMENRFPVPKPCREFFRLHKKLMARRPDRVIVNTRFYFHSLYGVLLGRRKKSRTIVIDHGSSHLSMHQPALNFLGECFEHGITFLLRCLRPEFYGVSRASLRWLTHFHIQGAGILSNGVDIQQIEERLAAPRRDFRREYQIPKDALIYVYTGRLLKEKGLLPLAEAFSRLSNQRKDVYLLMAGDGPLEEELKKNAPPRMLLTGKLEPMEVIDLLKASDIFCLPSVSEGFSTSLLEAAACKNYIIVTRSACPTELLLDRSYCSILSDAKSDGIARALFWAADHPAERAKAAEKTYRQLVDHFTWEKTVANVEKL